jgi:hypothetical protein
LTAILVETVIIAVAVVIAATAIVVPIGAMGHVEHTLDRTNGPADSSADRAANDAADRTGNPVALMGAPSCAPRTMPCARPDCVITASIVTDSVAATASPVTKPNTCRPVAVALFILASASEVPNPAMAPKVKKMNGGYGRMVTSL